jgi:hypothetical protein
VARQDWDALLDALEFQEELEQFDTVDEGPRLTIDELDQGMDNEPPNPVEIPEASEEREIPAELLNEIPAEPEPVRQPIGWMVAGFFALMAVGATAAALVFHERVAAIIASIR